MDFCNLLTIGREGHLSFSGCALAVVLNVVRRHSKRPSTHNPRAANHGSVADLLKTGPAMLDDMRARCVHQMSDERRSCGRTVVSLPGDFQWDGNWAAVDATKVEELVGGNVIDFGQTLFGLTIIGAHFGNVFGADGNVSVFWLFDFGTEGASSMSENPEGLRRERNAQTALLLSRVRLSARL